ncbi:MAG: hypothetical protein ACK5MQ_13450 [Pikeienuella sp.]
MRNIALAAALALAAPALLVAPKADAATVVTGGNVTVEVTLPLLDYALWGTASAGSPPARINSFGNPELEFPIREARIRNGAVSVSTVVDGGYNVRMNGGVYLFPLSDATDPTSEVAAFADVLVFGDIPEGVTIDRSIRWRNYVQGADGSYTDYSTGEVVELTAEQAALLVGSQLRTCCRHTLSGMTLNTAEGYIDGRIDGVRERDINIDGVIDENDYFHLFELVPNGSSTDLDVVLTDVMAQYLNFGFTSLAFGGDPAFADWAGGPLNFQGGDVVGRLSYYVNTTEMAVPVPAALPLLASGLGLFGFLRLRRSRQA